MPNDEQAIRTLLAEWQRATAAGDQASVLALIAEDAVFLQPGQPPILGRDAFGALGPPPFDLSFDQEVGEILISGDLATCWTHLAVTMTPRDRNPAQRRSGYTLTVFRKEGGRWLLARDANMLVMEG